SNNPLHALSKIISPPNGICRGWAAAWQPEQASIPRRSRPPRPGAVSGRLASSLRLDTGGSVDTGETGSVGGSARSYRRWGAAGRAVVGRGCRGRAVVR
uniref:Uncharacterized protein n=1 Tax=Triticum urartu TaxID=4572 RepID=A0A8R7JXE6_TRIUA